MSVRERCCRFLDHRYTRRAALVIGLLAGGLWLYSSGVYYRTLEPLTLAWRTPYVLGQACSQRSALHLALVQQPADAKFAIAVERLTHVGMGYGMDLDHVAGQVKGLGFVFACLPSEFNGGDYTLPAHLAIVIPYWFIVGLCAAVIARWVFVGKCAREPMEHAPPGPV